MSPRYDRYVVDTAAASVFLLSDRTHRVDCCRSGHTTKSGARFRRRKTHRLRTHHAVLAPASDLPTPIGAILSGIGVNDQNGSASGRSQKSDGRFSRVRHSRKWRLASWPVRDHPAGGDPRASVPCDRSRLDEDGTTPRAGAYRSDAAPGTYVVEVSLAGFVRAAEAVTIRSGRAAARVQLYLVISRRRGRARCSAGHRSSDGVLSAERMSRASHGRNCLELALLVPGKAPTPVFDPTRPTACSCLRGQWTGRQHHERRSRQNDECGGPLLNLPTDAVQEFQIATNRFGADLGRSASSVINVVTRSGTNTNRGTAAIFARDDAWQALPATLDNEDDALPFDRQQMSGAFGGPLRRDRLFWFAAGEFRHQDGAVLVGARDNARARSRRASRPLHSARGCEARSTPQAATSWAIRRAGHDTPPARRARHRSATQRRTPPIVQHSRNRVVRPRNNFVNSLSGASSTFLNETAGGHGTQVTFRASVRASFRMPRTPPRTRIRSETRRGFARAQLQARRASCEVDRRSASEGSARAERGQRTFPLDHTGDGRMTKTICVPSRSAAGKRTVAELRTPKTRTSRLRADAERRGTVCSGIWPSLRGSITRHNQSRADELNRSCSRCTASVNASPQRVARVGLRGASPSCSCAAAMRSTHRVCAIKTLDAVSRRALPIEVRPERLFPITTPSVAALRPTV